jgi:hypothetical protein
MILMLVSLVACSDKAAVEVPEVCRDLCQELVSTCGYAAYPDVDSCHQGCVYRLEEDAADIEDELECVTEAACDTFAIIECENQTGSR